MLYEYVTSVRTVTPGGPLPPTTKHHLLVLTAMSLFRPSLRSVSLRLPQTQRYASTYASASPTYGAFWRARLALTTASVALTSYYLGSLGVKLLIPEMGPIDTDGLEPAGSPVDTASLLASDAVIKQSPLYRSLSADPNWVEQEDVYSHLPPSTRRTKLVSGTLWGHRKISANKVFFDASGRESVSLLLLGTALGGHPNVIHGGVLATMLDEALGRLALRHAPSVVTARLEIDYKAPTRVKRGESALVVVKGSVAEVQERKVKVKGEIRDSKGKLLVQSEALFVVPRGWKPRPIGER